MWSETRVAVNFGCLLAVHSGCKRCRPLLHPFVSVFSSQISVCQGALLDNFWYRHQGGWWKGQSKLLANFFFPKNLDSTSLFPRTFSVFWRLVRAWIPLGLFLPEAGLHLWCCLCSCRSEESTHCGWESHPSGSSNGVWIYGTLLPEVSKSISDPSWRREKSLKDCFAIRLTEVFKDTTRYSADSRCLLGGFWCGSTLFQEEETVSVLCAHV